MSDALCIVIGIPAGAFSCISARYWFRSNVGISSFSSVTIIVTSVVAVVNPCCSSGLLSIS